MTDLNSHIADLRIQLRRGFADFISRGGPRCTELERSIETSRGTITIKASVTGQSGGGINTRTDLRLDGRRISRRDAEKLVS